MTTTKTAALAPVSRDEYLAAQEEQTKAASARMAAEELDGAKKTVEKHSQRIEDARELVAHLRAVVLAHPENYWLGSVTTAVSKIERDGNQEKDYYLPEAERYLATLQGAAPKSDRI